MNMELQKNKQLKEFSPQRLRIIHVANKYFMINSCSEMLRLKEIYTVEVRNVDTPGNKDKINKQPTLNTAVQT